MKERNLKITGMNCASCVKAIEIALKALEGVEDVSVNLATESARVVYDPSKISLEEIIEMIESMGYGVVKDEKTLSVKIGGMACAMCAKTIESAVSKLPRIKSVSVNLSTESARIAFDASITSLEEIKQTIEGLGYQFLGVGGEESGESMKEIKLELSGLSCGGCVGAVKAALENAGAKVKEITLNEAVIETKKEMTWRNT